MAFPLSHKFVAVSALTSGLNGPSESVGKVRIALQMESEFWLPFSVGDEPISCAPRRRRRKLRPCSPKDFADVEQRDVTGWSTASTAAQERVRVSDSGKI